MKKSINIIFYLIFPVVFFSCNYRIFKSNIDVYDGFEEPKLSNIWETQKLVAGNMKIQSEIVKSGKNAVQITLHPGDQVAEEEGSILERSELRESENLQSYLDRNYIYSFSLFLPADFPIVPNRLVIAQWKQRCPGEDCQPASPLIAIRYIDGKLQLTHLVGTEKTVLYQSQDNVRNQWLDFKFQIRFSTTQNGRIVAWLNDNQICDYIGVNAFAENSITGYSSPSRFYFKTGLYRDQLDLPMTIYIDEYSKRQISP